MEFEGEWRFNVPGPVPPELNAALLRLVRQIAAPVEGKAVFETFKEWFAVAAGKEYGPSSDRTHAERDLQRDMDAAAGNEATFIEAFHAGCEDLRRRAPEIQVPDEAALNRVLAEHGSAFRVDGQRLITAQRPAGGADSRGYGRGGYGTGSYGRTDDEVLPQNLTRSVGSFSGAAFGEAPFSGDPVDGRPAVEPVTADRDDSTVDRVEVSTDAAAFDHSVADPVQDRADEFDFASLNRLGRTLVIAAKEHLKDEALRAIEQLVLIAPSYARAELDGDATTESLTGELGAIWKSVIASNPPEQVEWHLQDYREPFEAQFGSLDDFAKVQPGPSVHSELRGTITAYSGPPSAGSHPQFASTPSPAVIGAIRVPPAATPAQIEEVVIRAVDRTVVRQNLERHGHHLVDLADLVLQQLDSVLEPRRIGDNNPPIGELDGRDLRPDLESLRDTLHQFRAALAAAVTAPATKSNPVVTWGAHVLGKLAAMNDIAMVRVPLVAGSALGICFLAQSVGIPLTPDVVMTSMLGVGEAGRAVEKVADKVGGPGE